MTKVLSVIICCFLSWGAYTQPIHIGPMSLDFFGLSGLETIYNPSTGHFDYWGHRDEGPAFQSEIYSFRINDLNTMTRNIDLGITMRDWEDMAIDEAENIYLGDFGNWVNATQFRILKIPSPNTYPGNPASVDIIEYEYPGLVDFDCESMIHFNKHLYMFTKSNEGDSSDKLTHCYKVPDVPHPMGLKYEAELVGSFMTEQAGDPDSDYYRVAAAAISPNKNVLALTTYTRLWIFSCFEEDDFFNGSVQSFDMGPKRQYESLCFVNNHELLIGKEGNSAGDPARLYYFNVAPLIDDACLDCNKARNPNFAKINHAWSRFLFSPANANLTTSSALAEIDVITPGTSSWHINMRHKTLILENGKTYRVGYKAYADANRTMAVILNNQGGTLGYNYHLENLTTTPTYYTHTFTMIEPTDYNTYLSFNVGNTATDDVYIDDIVLAEVGDCPIGTIDLDISVILQGPYNSSLGMMNDDLNGNGLLPNCDPFEGVSKAYPASAFSATGSDAIIDWVLVELRHAAAPHIVNRKRPALLQADGDVVDVDGVSAVVFNDVPLGDYHVAVRHRNHLGVMATATVTATP